MDLGAYEFQTPASVISYAWLQHYGLPADGSADYVHSDADGANNYHEWCSGTNPTNALSVLRLLDPVPGVAGATVRWQSVTNRAYLLQRSTSLSAQSSFLTLASNIPGQPVTTIYVDTNAVGRGPFFYRVGIQD